MKWIQKWEVPSSDGVRVYAVAMDINGEFGCSCPQWKFRRRECKHIASVKANMVLVAAGKFEPTHLAQAGKPLVPVREDRAAVIRSVSVEAHQDHVLVTRRRRITFE